MDLTDNNAAGGGFDVVWLIAEERFARVCMIVNCIRRHSCALSISLFLSLSLSLKRCVGSFE